MRAGDAEKLHAEVASVLDWWRVAGVDTAVAERPRDWLAPLKPREAPVDAPEPAAAALPATLDAFLPWLAEAEPALLGAPDRRLAPAGDAQAELMILIDMPCPEDVDAGLLLSGPTGRLFDRMLAAIGLSREAVWLAPLFPARPPGGKGDAAPLAPIALHHIALVGPKRLLLMGQCVHEALIGRGPSRGRWHKIEISGRQVPAVATFSPARLLGQPTMKAAAWADLRMMLRGDEA